MTLTDLKIAALDARNHMLAAELEQMRKQADIDKTDIDTWRRRHRRLWESFTQAVGKQRKLQLKLKEYQQEIWRLQERVDNLLDPEER